ncbi:hypothetical protein JTB14_026342 [Gonioctena quinquepunctata]|nr:hypothetical protein JTB14_026342 [Gonioctena quinquepunctata]
MELILTFYIYLDPNKVFWSLDKTPEFAPNAMLGFDDKITVDCKLERKRKKKKKQEQNYRTRRNKSFVESK